MSDPAFTEGAGITALGLAAARSVETGRSDRLIEDPFARALFEAANSDLAMRLEWPAEGETVSDREALHLHGSRYIGLRTRFYDDALIAAANDGIRQAVLVGAGLDTRALRCDLPADLTVFEIDQPAVLEYKRSVLDAKPVCGRRLVGTDLRGDWELALRAADLDPGQPTIWIAEGLMPYLTVLEQASLLGAIDGLAAPATRLAFDRLVGDPKAEGRAAALSEKSGIDMDAMFAGGDGQGMGDLLRFQGWTTSEEPVAAVAARYGRDLADPFAPQGEEQTEPPWLETAFVTACR